MSFLWVVMGLAVALFAYVMWAYNRLVHLRQQVNEAWSDIQVQMKRRYNLIPNLVETVKGYAGHEKSTLEEVTRARTAAMASTGSPSAQAGAENMLSGALKSLFALSEAYPDLKASDNFRELQGELSELEDHIQKARRYYNGTARMINVMIQQFPSNLVARQFAFVLAEFFELDEAEAEQVRAVPKVGFD
jgi:LemA protein